MSQIRRKVCSLFGYFDNFIRLFVANNLRLSLDMDTVFLWARARVEHIFIAVFAECHVSRFDERARVVTWLPSPTLRREWGKKADMFEGNVLVKKYRGGRQEDNLKKGFALFWDLSLEFLIHFTFQTLLTYTQHSFYFFYIYLKKMFSLMFVFTAQCYENVRNIWSCINMCQYCIVYFSDIAGNL